LKTHKKKPDLYVLALTLHSLGSCNAVRFANEDGDDKEEGEGVESVDVNHVHR